MDAGPGSGACILFGEKNMMTQQEFRQAMRRGLGRCVLAVQADPERYRDEVLWTCSHPISLDAQCEEVSVWYVWQLVCGYRDRQPFLRAAITALEEAKPAESQQVMYLAELLGMFAQHGYKRAAAALKKKYTEIYDLLMTMDCPEDDFQPENDSFVELCRARAVDVRSFLSIAGDIGRLLLTRSGYEGEFVRLEMKETAAWRRAVARRAAENPALAAYRRGVEEYYGNLLVEDIPFEAYTGEDDESPETAKTTAESAPARPDMPEEDHMYQRSQWLADYGTPAERASFAETYLRAEEPAARAEAVSMFVMCPYPGDPAPLMADAVSSHERLHRGAWLALQEVQHPAVRDFAVEHLFRQPEWALPVLQRNPGPGDDALLLEMVQRMPMDDETVVHQVYYDVLDSDFPGSKTMAEVLRYVYDHHMCPRCRFDVVRVMGKRRLLTDEILQECCHDSNADIRKYAAQLLRRRRKK